MQEKKGSQSPVLKFSALSFKTFRKTDKSVHYLHKLDTINSSGSTHKLDTITAVAEHTKNKRISVSIVT